MVRVEHATAARQVRSGNKLDYDWWDRSRDYPKQLPLQADERREPRLTLTPPNDHQFNETSKTIKYATLDLLLIVNCGW